MSMQTTHRAFKREKTDRADDELSHDRQETTRPKCSPEEGL